MFARLPWIIAATANTRILYILCIPAWIFETLQAHHLGARAHLEGWELFLCQNFDGNLQTH